jgi:hypothetical protein
LQIILPNEIYGRITYRFGQAPMMTPGLCLHIHPAWNTCSPGVYDTSSKLFSDLDDAEFLSDDDERGTGAVRTDLDAALFCDDEVKVDDDDADEGGEGRDDLEASSTSKSPSNIRQGWGTNGGGVIACQRNQNISVDRPLSST